MKGAVSNPRQPCITPIRVEAKSISGSRAWRLMEKKRLKKLEKRNGQKDKKGSQADGQEARSSSGFGQAEGQEDKEMRHDDEG